MIDLGSEGGPILLPLAMHFTGVAGLYPWNTRLNLSQKGCNKRLFHGNRNRLAGA